MKGAVAIKAEADPAWPTAIGELKAMLRQNTPRAYWDGARDGRLLVQRCVECGRHQFYPRPFCTACLSERIDWVEAKGSGRVVSAKGAVTRCAKRSGTVAIRSECPSTSPSAT